jgi:hypothetical protein
MARSLIVVWQLGGAALWLKRKTQRKPQSPEPAEAPTPEKTPGRPRAGRRSPGCSSSSPDRLIALSAGGYFGYTFLSHGKGKAGQAARTESKAKADGKVVLFSVDPFVVNLSEPGRYSR